MKALLLSFALVFSFVASTQVALGAQSSVSAKKGGKKNEPAPKDRDERDEDKGGENSPGSREETYEGNDRGGGDSYEDGGGYGGGGGGMGGELFRVHIGDIFPVTHLLKTEDRGTVIVYTKTEQFDTSASETCSTVTTTVVDKATQKVISEDVEEFCNNWPL